MAVLRLVLLNIVLYAMAIKSSLQYTVPDSFADSLLQEVMNRVNQERGPPEDFDLPSLEDYPLSPPSETQPEQDLQKPELSNIRVAKEYDSHTFHPRHDALLGREPSIRDQEYLEHSSLFGHQFVQGGAGEGYQRLKPDGSMKNMEVVKSDNILPAYCNPPNPCPLGYRGEDGCLENFVNTAEFSRRYQAAQECMCDSEHMFQCPGNNRENEINALARSIQNVGIMDSTLDRIIEGIGTNDGHKVVAKKFFAHKEENPFLEGEKLPVVAKKAPKLIM